MIPSIYNFKFCNIHFEDKSWSIHSLRIVSIRIDPTNLFHSKTTNTLHISSIGAKWFPKNLRSKKHSTPWHIFGS